MLNTPNEWHNEEDTEEYFEDEELSEEEYENDNQYDDDEYEDDENSEEDDDEETSDENSDDGLKKKIIIAVAILVIFLLVVAGIFGIQAIKNKNSQEIAPVETAVDDSPINLDSVDVDSEQENSSDNDEVSIDVEVENETATVNNTEETDGLAVPENSQPASDNQTEKIASEANSGLQVPENEKSPLASVAENKNNTVTVSIGDVGRKSPFKPAGEPKELETNIELPKEFIADNPEEGLNFDVIEPPELGQERADIAKLLQTKVTGILFDTKKPSAIVNIDGADQLVRIGDNLGGFEIISITKNKVVIRDGNNVYRASVGQPLNAEKIYNPIEISNLETKFWGSTKH